jgi:hypothetical protein
VVHPWAVAFGWGRGLVTSLLLFFVSLLVHCSLPQGSLFGSRSVSRTLVRSRSTERPFGGMSSGGVRLGTGGPGSVVSLGGAATSLPDRLRAVEALVEDQRRQLAESALCIKRQQEDLKWVPAPSVHVVCVPPHSPRSVVSGLTCVPSRSVVSGLTCGACAGVGRPPPRQRSRIARLTVMLGPPWVVLCRYRARRMLDLERAVKARDEEIRDLRIELERMRAARTYTRAAV